MKQNKRFLAMALAGAMTVGCLAGCGGSSSASGTAAPAGSAAGSASAAPSSGSKGTITVITMALNSDYWHAVQAGAILAGEEYGYKINVLGPNDESNAQEQCNQILDAVSAGTDAIVLSANNPYTVVSTAADVHADGMPLVFVNRGPSDYHVLDAENVAFVGSNETDAGKYQADALAEYFKAQGKTEIKYVLLQGTLGQVSQIKRCAGVLDGLKENGITATPVVELAAEYDRAKAIDKISPVLTSGQEFDCIISNNDSMACGAVEACEAANVDPSTIPIVGVDCTKDGAQMVQEGKMLMTVFQNPGGQGVGAVEAAINLINGKPANENTQFVKDESGESYSDSIVWIPFEPVNKDNVADYM